MKPSQLNQLTPLHSRYILPYFWLPLQDNALSFTPLQFIQFTRAIRNTIECTLREHSIVMNRIFDAFRCFAAHFCS